METTRCAVWIGGHEFQIEERPMPEPGPGEIRVRVHACGVCLTEVHSIAGHFGEPKPPRLMGHEYGGTIDAIGPDVSGLEIGMPVACAGQKGFSGHVVLRADRVFPIPANVSLERAAFVEPLVCSLAAAQHAMLPMGASALITGAGPMGLILLQLVRRRGATRILVSEPNPIRRALALRLGADQAIDPRETSVADAVAAFAPGSSGQQVEMAGGGVDVAFETAGHPAPLSDCLNAVKELGTVVMVGVAPVAARLDLELYRFHRRNITLKGSYGAAGVSDFKTAVKWVDQIEFEPMISHRFDLANIAKAFDVARNGSGVKTLVYPNSSELPSRDVS